MHLLAQSYTIGVLCYSNGYKYLLMSINMDYRQALKETMFRFDLKGVELAQRADVKRTQLSAFRTGKRDLYASTLQQIIEAMPPEAQAYYYELLKRSAVHPNASVDRQLTAETLTARGSTPPRK